MGIVGLRIGFHVEGAADEAFVRGLADKWCKDAILVRSSFKGRTGISHRRDIKKALLALFRAKECRYLVVVMDSDEDEWRNVKKEGWAEVPEEAKHATVLGVADRNIECWLSLDRDALAKELDCRPSDIPSPNPSGFVKREFGIQARHDAGSERIKRFVSSVVLFNWVNDDSFGDFYDQIRRLSKLEGCEIPNERERP